jgi:hypothetical protein
MPDRDWPRHDLSPVLTTARPEPAVWQAHCASTNNVCKNQTTPSH